MRNYLSQVKVMFYFKENKYQLGSNEHILKSIQQCNEMEKVFGTFFY